MRDGIGDRRGQTEDFRYRFGLFAAEFRQLFNRVGDLLLRFRFGEDGDRFRRFVDAVERNCGAGAGLGTVVAALRTHTLHHAALLHTRLLRSAVTSREHRRAGNRHGVGDNVADKRVDGARVDFAVGVDRKDEFVVFGVVQRLDDRRDHLLLAAVRKDGYFLLGRALSAVIILLSAEDLGAGKQAGYDAAQLRGDICGFNFVDDNSWTGRVFNSVRISRVFGINFPRLFVDARNFFGNFDVVFERGAHENAPASDVRVKLSGRIRFSQGGNELLDAHAVDRVGDHAQIGRTVRLGQLFNAVGDDLVFSRRADDKKLVRLGVDLNEPRVRHKRANCGEEAGRRRRADVVVVQGGVKFRSFRRVEQFKELLNRVERDSVVRADDKRLRRGIVDRNRAGIDGGDLGRKRRVVRAPDLPTQDAFVDRIVFREVRDRLFYDRLFLFGSPNDERLVIVIVGNARGGDQLANVADVVERRVVRADPVVGIESFDRVRSERAHDGVVVARVDCGEGSFGFLKFFCGAAKNEPRVNRVVRNFKGRLQVFQDGEQRGGVDVFRRVKGRCFFFA